MKNELVYSKKEEIYCDSRVIAEKLGKKHEYVMKKIEKLINNLNDLDTNFVVSKNPEIFTERAKEYRGQTFRYFEMNKPAFTLLVMGFTGMKALRVKRAFNTAFYQMEHMILNNANLEWRKSREQGKQVRLELTDEIKTFIDYAIDQGANEKGAGFYYTHITKLQYKALGLIEKNEKVDKEFRNTLDMMDLHNIITAEYHARQALLDGMEQGLHYKDIFQLAKQRVIEVANVLIIPKRKLIQ